MFCVGLSLLIVMLNRTLGHSPEPIPLVAASTGISSFRANAVVGPALMVLIMIARCSSAITIRELWINKVYYSQVLEGTWHARATR